VDVLSACHLATPQGQNQLKISYGNTIIAKPAPKTISGKSELKPKWIPTQTRMTPAAFNNVYGFI
jgi:hypothetical protein